MLPTCSADGARVVGVDFGVWVGQRKDDRRIGHLLDHLGRQDAGSGQAKEQIRIGNHVVQRAGVGGLGEFGLLWRHVNFAAFVDQPM